MPERQLTTHELSVEAILRNHARQTHASRKAENTGIGAAWKALRYGYTSDRAIHFGKGWMAYADTAGARA